MVTLSGLHGACRQKGNAEHCCVFGVFGWSAAPSGGGGAGGGSDLGNKSLPLRNSRTSWPRAGLYAVGFFFACWMKPAMASRLLEKKKKFARSPKPPARRRGQLRRSREHKALLVDVYGVRFGLVCAIYQYRWSSGMSGDHASRLDRAAAAQRVQRTAFCTISAGTTISYSHAKTAPTHLSRAPVPRSTQTLPWRHHETHMMTTRDS